MKWKINMITTLKGNLLYYGNTIKYLMNLESYLNRYKVNLILNQVIKNRKNKNKILISQINHQRKSPYFKEMIKN